MTYIDDQDAYERLANAVIKQAADDYRNAHKKLVKAPHDYESEKRIEDVTEFLRSQRFQGLTTIDGEYLLRRLNEEVREDRAKLSKRVRKTSPKQKKAGSKSKPESAVGKTA